METKKPKLMMGGHTDEVYTPENAIYSLLPYLNKKWLIWEYAWGKGSLAKHLEKKGFHIIADSDVDFLECEKSDNFQKLAKYDCIVTNPPYSKKYEFLKKAFEFNKPFAFLLPLTALEGKKEENFIENMEYN